MVDTAKSSAVSQDPQAANTASEMLLVTATQAFGTVQLQSGDVLINNFQVILESPEQIAEMRKLIASGRVPHLSIKEHDDIAKEVAEAENKMEGLRALLARSKPRVGMVSSEAVPTKG